jgi:hypothetical protein
VADKARAMAAAKDAGLDMARIEKYLANPEVKSTIEENLKLAETAERPSHPLTLVNERFPLLLCGF